MALKEKLTADLQDALRKRDEARLTALRLVIAAVTNAEHAKGGTLDDSEVLSIIAREARQHRESITEFQKAGREELVRRQEAELAVLTEYLPSQMGRDEIAEVARQVIEEVGATGPKDKGKVMSRLMPQLRGKAEGSEINEVVTEMLAGL